MILSVRNFVYLREYCQQTDVSQTECSGYDDGESVPFVVGGMSGDRIFLVGAYQERA